MYCWWPHIARHDCCGAALHAYYEIMIADLRMSIAQGELTAVSYT